MADGLSFGPNLIGARLLLVFNTVTLGAGLTFATVVARLPQISQRFKLRRAAAVVSAMGSGGTHGFRVDVGGIDSVIPGAAITAAETVINVNAGAPERIFTGGSLITLRAETPATTGSLTNFVVVIEVELVENDVTRNYGGVPRQY